MNEHNPNAQGARRHSIWHHAECYGCGPDNPRGLHASFPFDEETGEVRFSYTADPELQAGPGIVHGGVLAALLDEGQGVLCVEAGHLVMTDKLTIKYHRATPIGRELRVRCWITAVRKRRIYTRAALSDAKGDLLVSSSGVFTVLPERFYSRMFKSWGRDPRALQDFLDANRKRGREIRKRLREKNRSRD